MKFISTAWIEGDFERFERSSCLQTHADLGLANERHPFEIYMLAGIEKLPEAFVAGLAKKHIIFKDASEQTRRLLKKHERLSTVYNINSYEIYCFIRWLVVKEMVAPESFIHFDLDLFFNFDFEKLTKIFSGQTGTFGSPCLTCISDYGWLDTYNEAFDLFTEDREALQVRFKYQGNNFRKDFMSDQDLISEMERVGALPYQTLDHIQSNYCAFINPLWPYQGRDKRLTYSMVDGRDHFNEVPVLFWHLQNNFAEYLSRYSLLQSFEGDWPYQYLPVRLGLPFLQLAPSAENFAFYAIGAMQRTLSNHPQIIAENPVLHRFQRSWVSDWFITQKQGRGVFSKDYWWEDDVFQN